jgi:hypothetical protein
LTQAGDRLLELIGIERFRDNRHLKSNAAGRRKHRVEGRQHIGSARERRDAS